MPSINYRIDKTYLAFHAINTSVASDGEKTFIPGKEYREHINAFKSAAEKADPVACKFLKAGARLFDLMVLATHEGKNVGDLAARAEQFLQERIQDKSFQPVFQDTQQAVLKLENEWNALREKSLSHMINLTGLDFDRSFDVYVTHPSQAAGHNSYGKIFTTFRTGFPNYNTVYLWHEILHSYIKCDDDENYALNEKVPHSVIQLIADNELRVQLGGGTYPPFEGHYYLTDTMEHLLPAWKEYLKKEGKRDISTFVKEAEALEKKRTELKKTPDAAPKPEATK